MRTLDPMELAIIVTPRDFEDFKHRLGDHVHWISSTHTINDPRGDFKLFKEFPSEPRVIFYNMKTLTLTQSDMGYLEREKGIHAITYWEFIEEYGCPLL